MTRSVEPGISRFRVRLYEPSRNDVQNICLAVRDVTLSGRHPCTIRQTIAPVAPIQSTMLADVWIPKPGPRCGTDLV